MSLWVVLAIAYGLPLVTSPIAYPDGPEPGWLSEVFLFGTMLAVVAIPVWLVAS